MDGKGRPCKSSAAQRAEVLRLFESGRSMREIAAEVFGDARLKGRVERILKRPPGGVEAVATLSEEIDFAGLSETEQFRLLFERRMAEHWARGEGPSMTELRNLMDVRWRLDQMEVRDRLHARRETRR